MAELEHPPRVNEFLEIVLPICWKGHWLSMDELVALTKLHPGSIRWCMKQLKTGEEGNFLIRRRKREPIYKGITEFYIKRKPQQTRFAWED